MFWLYRSFTLIPVDCSDGSPGCHKHSKPHFQLHIARFWDLLQQKRGSSWGAIKLSSPAAPHLASDTQPPPCFQERPLHSSQQILGSNSGCLRHEGGWFSFARPPKAEEQFQPSPSTNRVVNLTGECWSSTARNRCQGVHFFQEELTKQLRRSSDHLPSQDNATASTNGKYTPKYAKESPLPEPQLLLF